ncbi:glycoside hydrolase family 108 protein [Methylobacterium nodulans]|uniref:Uncharacterized protein n=1 Tax=Methylobacterium nodulans (strain LMG 21967 / CNCM I-2342 / ORS 2060) TaxID=460265 RepID=B8IIL0_METNO|nr:glycosyl hydrolase 108 family protein [Methylobacterium nodulans]ACL59887.1 protein of unknown function DUF847 [Methylobacterium nodulans ORS 2060]
MAASSYDRALKLVLAHEGGYVDRPDDPGGPTNLGVTLGTLSAVLGRPATRADVRALTPAKVAPIYRTRYWDAVRGDELPAGVDYAVFDFAVNSGPARAAIALQRLVGVADDGVIGAVTLAAVARTDQRWLVNALCDSRLVFMKSLTKSWPVFGKGWTKRVAGVRTEALALVTAPVVVTATTMVRPAGGAPPKAGTVQTGGLPQALKRLWRGKAA